MMELPKDTLIEVEIVNELRGEVGFGDVYCSLPQTTFSLFTTRNSRLVAWGQGAWTWERFRYLRQRDMIDSDDLSFRKVHVTRRKHVTVTRIAACYVSQTTLLPQPSLLTIFSSWCWFLQFGINI